MCAIAEPAQPPTATPARLHELSERIEQLTAQLQALPIRELERIEDLQDRALTLTTQREHAAARLSALPEPTRRLGRERDPHSIERSQLTSTLEALDRALQDARNQNTQLERQLGVPAEVRAERDALKEAISQSTRERSMVRDELAEREIRTLGLEVVREHDVDLGIEL